MNKLNKEESILYKQLGNKNMRSILTMLILISGLSILHSQTMEDIDGNIYNTVNLNKKRWTVENLKTTRYSNGDSISYEAVDSIWGNLAVPAFSTYNNDISNRDTFGNLYNFYVLEDDRNICPVGWHVPTYEEWNTLINNLGGDLIAGGHLKDTTSSLWHLPNIGATNSSGLSVMPAGFRFSNNGFHKGKFAGIGGNGGIWTSTSTSDSTSIVKYFVPGSTEVGNIENMKSYGFSVRCVTSILSDIGKIEKDNNIKVYPTIAENEITLESLNHSIIYKVAIRTIQGELIKIVNVNENFATIDISNLMPGMYICIIDTHEGYLTKKFYKF